MNNFDEFIEPKNPTVANELITAPLGTIYNFRCIPVKQLFYSSDSAYGVYVFNTQEQLPYSTSYADPYGIFGKEYTEVYSSMLVGKMPHLETQQEYRVKAKVAFSSKYKKYQYEVISVEQDKPKTVEDTRKFLSSLLTENQTNVLLAAYPDIIDIVMSGRSNEVDLSKTKGIKEYTFGLIKQKIEENFVNADIISLLAPLGISFNKIKKLLNDEPNPHILRQKILEDPYVVVDVPGISFRQADKIALKLNPNFLSSKTRLIAFVKHFLQEVGEEKGHTWITKEELDLGIKENAIECIDLLDTLIANEKDSETFLHIENEKIGFKFYYETEKKIWEKLLEINNSEPLSVTNEQINTGIENAETELGFQYTDEQKEKIIEMTHNSLCTISGLAGTGKTTLTRGLLNIYKVAGYSIATTALSARAAKRISEVTHFPSSTIHRLLASQGLSNFFYNEENPMPYSVILLDEASMVYAGLFWYLIRAIKPGAKLILSGDNKQLPPLSWGQTFGDILEKSNLQINYLTKIMRQAADSGIISSANLIRNGEDPLEGKKHFKFVMGKLQDMYFMARDSKEELNDIAIKTYLKTVKEIGVENTQIIVPRKKDCINSVREMNKKIQSLLISEDAQFMQYGDTKFKLGDRIMHIKNNYQKGVFNGDLGFVSGFGKNEDDQDILIAQYSDFEIEYTRDELNELELAYAITCHKMQGGQVHTVIGVIDNSHFMLLDQTLLYTLISRSTNRCLLLFQPFAYDKAISESKVENKNTWMKYF